MNREDADAAAILLITMAVFGFSMFGGCEATPDVPEVQGEMNED